ncbi:hypothetical protein Tco_0364797 [Tanacetum coccineum]
MAALRYRDEHNKVGYLQKPKGSDDYHQILDFLRASHIRSPELGPPAILATINETLYTITEDSVVSTSIRLMIGKLTFYKNKFSPQWRFLVHTILHCLSSKSGSWDQFGSSLAVALICLSDGRKFNWSSYIFKGMLSSKRFANMKLNFEGKPMQLLAAMLPQVQEGEGAGVAAQAVPPSIHEPISDPNLASFSQVLRTKDEHWEALQAFPQVSTLVQKVNSLETELKANKKLFKDVVAKEEEDAVDLDALIALANAAVTVDSNIPPGGASNNPAASSHIPTDVPTERTKKQLADERLSEIEAARLEALERERSEKEKAEIARQDAIYAKQLEQEVEMSASQRETRQAELLGADVNDDNFAGEVVGIINHRKRAFAEQSSTTIYSTGWSMKYVKSLTDEQLIAEFEKIRMAVADLKSHETTVRDSEKDW